MSCVWTVGAFSSTLLETVTTWWTETIRRSLRGEGVPMSRMGPDPHETPPVEPAPYQCLYCPGTTYDASRVCPDCYHERRRL